MRTHSNYKGFLILKFIGYWQVYEPIALAYFDNHRDPPNEFLLAEFENIGEAWQYIDSTITATERGIREERERNYANQ